MNLLKKFHDLVKGPSWELDATLAEPPAKLAASDAAALNARVKALAAMNLTLDLELAAEVIF